MNIRLKRGKAKPVWAGHPWIYSGAIAKAEGSVAPGQLATLLDHNGTLIGWGHYSADAQIALRIWAYARAGAKADATPPAIEALLEERLAAAVRRRQLVGLPAPGTNAYRLVNSEGDRMPGITVDVYGDSAVLMLGTPGAAALQDRIIAFIKKATGVVAVYPRVSADAARLESLPSVDDPALDGERRDVVIEEHGIRYTIDPKGGQKSGFYLDQREHRQAVAQLARGKRLVDVCSFGGGFSLNALKAGARTAVAIDTSPRAEKMARAAAEANGIDGLAFDRRDAFVALRERAAEGQRFDIAVVDPPKFARSRRDVDAALQKYMRLNELAVRALDDDGIIVSCSCSRHVSREALERAVADAAQRANRTLHLLRAGGLPPDHPTLASFPEGRYLKVLYFHTSKRT